MLNRKDLWGGVVLGTALSCVLYVGAMRTPANANANVRPDAVSSQDGAQPATSAARVAGFDKSASK